MPASAEFWHRGLWGRALRAVLLLVAAALPTACLASAPTCLPDDQTQCLASAFNGRVLSAESTPRPYDYFVAGHLYGAPRASSEAVPGRSLPMILAQAKRQGGAFFMSLGDALKSCRPLKVKLLRMHFTKELPMPFFNAVGNHDVLPRACYLENFPGPTYYHFQHGGVLHIVLDTELDVGTISGPQLQLLREQLQHAEQEPSISSVAIYGHKLIFTDGNPDFAVVHRRVNNRNGYQSEGRFQRDLLPSLRRVAATKQVIWFAGDVGVSRSLPMFYHREADRDLTWIATGIGDRQEDKLLRVSVDEAGRMSVQVQRVDGQRAKPLEHFGLDFWKARFGG